MVNGRVNRIIDSTRLAADRDLQQRLLGVGVHAVQDTDTGAADATARVDPPWSMATTTPLVSTPMISAASTGTLGRRHSRRGRRAAIGASPVVGSTGGKTAYRSAGSAADWPGSPGGGEVDTQRLFAPAGPTPAGATELQSGGTYVRFRPIGEIGGNRQGLGNDQRSKKVRTPLR
jgi:hypothetical protein